MPTRKAIAEEFGDSSIAVTADVTAARLVAEIGDDRSRYPTREALAADAGMSPVARESGKAQGRHLPMGL